MIRNLKALGISLVAMLAMSALGAATASAVTTDVLTTLGGQKALLTGVAKDHKFQLTNSSGGVISKFECTTSKFAATGENGSSDITAEVLYENKINETPHVDKADCTTSLGEARIDTTGCGYTLTGDTSNSHGDGLDAPVHVYCEGTSTIKITNTSPAVTISVPGQTPTFGGVTYTNVHNHPNVGDPTAILVTATVTGVTSNCTPTFTCTLGGIPHHGNNSDYTGTIIMTGYEDKVGLPTPVTEGARISVEMS